MYERLTERALRVVFSARQAVSEFGSDTVDPEHLFMGLLQEEGGFCQQILRTWRDVLENEVRSQLVSTGKIIPQNVEVRFGSAAKRVLQFAEKEADRLHHTRISDGHILLGLMSEEKSPVCTILMRRDLFIDETRAALINFMGNSSKESNE
jgi:ATP-dependent Clp protease ATP-binding subunit ClpA